MTGSKKKFLRGAVIAPLAIWLVLFLVLPYVNLFLYSFWKNGAFKVERTFTLENYIRFFSVGTIGGGDSLILLDTLRNSLIVTLITVVFSFPLAYFIRFVVKKTKNKSTFYMMAIIPLWVSYIMRAYAWKIILGTNGVLNSFLMWLGVTDKPLDILLYSNVSIIIAMVHIYSPYVLMPIYTALEEIPEELLEASHDLGVNGFKTLFRVVIPLSVPGIVTGATYSFALSKYDEISKILGGKGASDCADAIRGLLEKINLSLTLSEQGIEKKDVDWLTENCMKVSAANLTNHPVHFEKEEVKELYLRCL